MTAIDAGGMLQRLKRLIPSGWFSDVAPLRDIVLGGVSDALAWIWSQGQVVLAGTRRIGTTGWLLDIDAYGFFGSRVLRRGGENDDAWRRRYTREIFRVRVTRAGITQALTDLTGKAPTILEFWNSADCGAYNAGGLAYAGGATIAPQFAGFENVPAAQATPVAYRGWNAPLSYYGSGHFAYLRPGVLPTLPPSSVATPGARNALGGYGSGYLVYFETSSIVRGSTGTGCYGTYDLPHQFTVRPRRGVPVLANAAGAGAYNTSGFAYGGGQRGMPRYQGWNSGLAFYDTDTFAWSAAHNPSPFFAGAGFLSADAVGSISDDEIVATVMATKAAGVKATVEILN